MAIILNYLVGLYADRRREIHRIILTSFEHSLTIDRVLDTVGQVYSLTPQASEALINAGVGLCQCQTTLIRLLHPDISVFHYTDKSHYVLHMAILWGIDKSNSRIDVVWGRLHGDCEKINCSMHQGKFV